MKRKILKFFVFLFVSVVVLLFGVYYFMDESLPEGVEGEHAEQLADEMLAALNKPGFDSLEYISFTFKGLHTIKWDLENDTATVIWSDNEVTIDLGKSMNDFTMLEFKAYEYFINDTFWLVAPFKVRDDGVVRSFMNVPNGRGLLVTYTKGGVTPGDSYLWILDDRGFPIAWKLWVDIIPVGGLKFTWEDWQEYEDVWFSQLHKNTFLDLEVSELEVR